MDAITPLIWTGGFLLGTLGLMKIAALVEEIAAFLVKAAFVCTIVVVLAMVFVH